MTRSLRDRGIAAWTRFQAQPPRKKALRAALIGVPVALIVAFIAVFEWNMLKGPLEGVLSARTGRTVHIDGDLDVDLSWTPRVTVHGVRIENEDWAPDPDLAIIERVTADVRLWPALFGSFIFPRIEVESPTIRGYRDATGNASWGGEGGGEGATLPEMHQLIVNNGDVAIEDAVRGICFTGSFNSRQDETEGTGRFLLEGDGTLNARPFVLRLNGDPLLNAGAGTPYAFEATIEEGATRIVADGRLARAFDLGAVEADVTFSGQDLADLFYLTGLALPNTPPYALSGQVRRSDAQYEFNGITGTVGDSDLSGNLAVDASGERPYLTADMRSAMLDFDDIATLFGAPPATGGSETVSADQEAQEVQLVANDRLLPDAPLDISRVRNMDADVAYTADSVVSETLPLTGIALALDLDNGVLTLDSVTFSFTQGEVSGNARIDATADVPFTEVDFTLIGGNLEEFFPAGGEGDTPMLSGDLRARFQLSGSGFSVHEAASNADGMVGVIIVPGGEIRAAFAELLGINVLRGLGLLFTGDQSTVAIRCGIAQFRADNGLLHAEGFAFDTAPVLAVGSGTINLDDETLDLVIDGRPKEPRLISLMAPITVEGSLRSPQIGVQAAGAIAQTGVAAALGTLLTPFAGIIPFISVGTEEDANCTALLNGAIQGEPEDRAAEIAPDAR
jgi:uncharacterized protein involved in outer membrane biogenesis